MRLALTTAALALGSALAGTALAAPANQSAYIGLRGSYVIADDGQTRSDPNFAAYDYDQHYEPGYAAGISMGWYLPANLRFEIAGDYRQADLSRVIIRRDDTVAALYTPGEVRPVDGHSEIGTGMANLYYDLDLDMPFVPYVGAGVGGAFVSYKIVDPNGGPQNPLNPITFTGKDNTWAFAYQFMGGIAVPLEDGITLSLGYTYFRTNKFNYVNSVGESMRTDIKQQSIDVGVQFHI